MTELFIANGATSGNDIVEKETNTVDNMTPIAAFDPEQGTALRLLNRVAKGSENGVPVYMKLRDSNGDPLPTTTSLQFEIELAGSSSRHKVSVEQGEISVYNSYSIQDQRDKNQVDAVKFILTEPEILGGQPVESVQWSYVETLYLSADSAAQIDWSQSEMYVDSNAIVGPLNA